ncbi:VanZ family protein [Streptomyces sp. NPDC058459]|uniref:VanZ family protein n=1 Tax=Streptomyces sp. NPDC058459 TaxID=3346508 RepID=UPI0036562193
MARTALRLPTVLRTPWRREHLEKTEPEQAPRPAPVVAERRPLPLPIRLPIMVLAFVFMVAFAIALARVTLEPSPASEALTHSNMHPGNSLKAYFDYGTVRETLKQVGGNILLGVPFGVLVPVLAPRARGVLQVLLLTALVMLMVELTQGALITGRAFDIDDVILNTTGALLGWLLLGRRLGRAVHARRPKPVTE